MPGTAHSSRPATSFTATASARLVAVDFRLAPTIGFDPLLDPGQSVAQAQLDSLGTSQAYAANTYPGATVLALPGLIGTLTEGAIGSEDIPPYPLYAQSSYPTTPESHLTAGLYDLSTSSSSAASTAAATDGATTGAASASVDPASGEVVARAESTVAGLRISDALSVNGVRSVAEVRQSPSGELQRASGFEVSALTILGQRVAVTPDGLSLLGQDVVSGVALSGTLQPVPAALAGQGITIEPVPAQELEDGVTSAGLRITMPIAPPPSLASGIERMTAVFTVGVVTASVSNRALPMLGSGTVAVSPGPVGGSAPVSGGSGPSFGSTPDTGGVRMIAPTPAGSASSPVPATTATPSLDSAIPVDVSAARVYPVLVVAGGALFAAARLFSHLGGKHP